MSAHFAVSSKDTNQLPEYAFLEFKQISSTPAIHLCSNFARRLVLAWSRVDRGQRSAVNNLSRGSQRAIKCGNFIRKSDGNAKLAGTLISHIISTTVCIAETSGWKTLQWSRIYLTPKISKIYFHPMLLMTVPQCYSPGLSCRNESCGTFRAKFIQKFCVTDRKHKPVITATINC